MALTAQQEADLLSMLDAYKTGEQIDDLPAASTDATDKKIEVFDTKSGASQCMDLTAAVDMANAPWCGGYGAQTSPPLRQPPIVAALRC